MTIPNQRCEFCEHWEKAWFNNSKGLCRAPFNLPKLIPQGIRFDRQIMNANDGVKCCAFKIKPPKESQ